MLGSAVPLIFVHQFEIPIRLSSKIRDNTRKVTDGRCDELMSFVQAMRDHWSEIGSWISQLGGFYD